MYKPRTSQYTPSAAVISRTSWVSLASSPISAAARRLPMSAASTETGPSSGSPARRAASIRFASLRKWSAWRARNSGASAASASRSAAKPRMDSSIQNRGSDASLPRCSRLLSSRPSSAPGSGRHTASPASSVQPPANTASRWNKACSGSVSWSWLHSMVARIVRCRAGHRVTL